MMKKYWDIWKYSLGSFSDEKTRPYDDYVALVRTFLFVSYLITNMFIISNTIRHWGDVKECPESLPYPTQKI